MIRSTIKYSKKTKKKMMKKQDNNFNDEYFKLCYNDNDITIFNNNNNNENIKSLVLPDMKTSELNEIKPKRKRGRPRKKPLISNNNIIKQEIIPNNIFTNNLSNNFDIFQPIMTPEPHNINNLSSTNNIINTTQNIGIIADDFDVTMNTIELKYNEPTNIGTLQPTDAMDNNLPPNIILNSDFNSLPKLSSITNTQHSLTPNNFELNNNLYNNNNFEDKFKDMSLSLGPIKCDNIGDWDKCQFCNATKQSNGNDLFPCNDCNIAKYCSKVNI